MKLPKHFGPQGFQGMLAQAQGAMARAKQLDQELATQSIVVNRGQVILVFNGLGELQSLKIDKAIVDPDDVEALEDLIVGAVRDGFAQAVALRDKRVQEIMPNVPGLDDLGL